jgi:twitching motility two-component system response regulator PilH
MTVRTILIVADVQMDRARLEGIVAKAGYSTIHASRKQALETAIEERPDLALLDVTEDDMHGFRICRELSTHFETRDIPVIIVSDHTQRVDRLWAEQQGAKGLVKKPYATEDVLGQIRRFD